MEIAQILFQIISAIIIVFAIFQKEKWKMMLWYTINNIMCVLMYFVFGRTTTAILCVVAAVRTFIFMFYSLKKIKPNYIWLIIFESAFVLTTILTWQDALDLMPLFALLVAGFGSWQENDYVLRVSYIINELIYVIYKFIIGAYISMAVELISLICTLFSFIYYCLLKKEKLFLQLIFKRNKSQLDNIDNHQEVTQQEQTEQEIEIQ